MRPSVKRVQASSARLRGKDSYTQTSKFENDMPGPTRMGTEHVETLPVPHLTEGDGDINSDTIEVTSIALKADDKHELENFMLSLAPGLLFRDITEPVYRGEQFIGVALKLEEEDYLILEKLGLQSTDVVKTVNGMSVRNADDLWDILPTFVSGQAEFTIEREGTPQIINVSFPLPWEES